MSHARTPAGFAPTVTNPIQNICGFVDALTQAAAIRGAAPNRDKTTLFAHLNVVGNVGFARLLLRRPHAEISATVANMIALLGLEAMEARFNDQFSGGQKQRVALARAKVAWPSASPAQTRGDAIH